MHFEIVHELDIPLDAVELAVVSPDLFSNLLPKLSNVEQMSQKEHKLEGNVLHRVWAYQATVRVPVFAKKVVTRDMLAWDESSTYDLKAHEARWSVSPHVKADWKKYFQAEGSYKLVPNGDGRTQRKVEGDITLRVPVVQKMAERAILAEVRRMFDAEAEALREMATLI